MAESQDYILPSTETESLRLHMQGARLYGGTAFLDPFLEGRPASALDVGSGTGLFARYVAQRLPACAVTGVEPDDERRRFARAQGSLPNLEFARGSLPELSFEDNSFDLVYCRFVLVHALDPLRSLQEMTRVTRPGGRIAAHEMVHSGIWHSPEKPAFAALLRRIIEVMRGRGAAPDQGLHLATGMVRAGLQDVRVHVLPHTCLADQPLFEDYRMNWIRTLEGIGSALGEELDGVPQALAELGQVRPGDFLLEISVVAEGVKPLASR